MDLSAANEIIQIVRGRLTRRFNSVTQDETYMRCIRAYYTYAEEKEYDDLSEEARTAIEESPEHIKEFCWELCKEALNRDFIHLVRYGNSGNVGREVYKALREEDPSVPSEIEGSSGTE